jgi:hypothetical protein
MWTWFRDLVNAATWDRQRPSKSLYLFGTGFGTDKQTLSKMPS